MNDSEVKLEDVVGAIRAIYDPTTPNERRLMFSREIEDMKERLAPPSAISLAFQLTQHAMPIVVHLGWNTLEHVIRYKWAEMDSELTAQLKSRLLSEAFSGDFAVGHGPDAQIKVAVYRCVACALEADWPQRWPDFLLQLQQVLAAPSSSYSQCEMALMVLERLVEDVHTLGPAAGAEDSPRQKELQVALKGNMQGLLNMTTERLRIYACDQGVDDACQVAKTGLELLASIFDWIAVTVLEEGVNNYVDIISVYISTTTPNRYDVAVEAAKCLRSVASRRSGKNREAWIVASMMRDGPMAGLVQAVDVAASPNAPLESYPLLRALCELVSTLTLRAADVWDYLDNGGGCGQPPNFANLLSTLAVLFTHPATYIRSESAHVFATFSAHPAISSSDEFQRLLRPLLPLLLAYMNRTQVLDASKPYYATLMMDREEEEREQNRDFLALCERCSKAVRENSQRHGLTVFLSMVDEWLRGRFLTNAETLHKDEWAAVKRFIGTLVSTADGTNETHIAPFVSTFDVVLGKIQVLCAERKYPTANLSLSVVSALFPVFNYCPDRMPSLLELFKGMLSVDNPNNGDSNIFSLKRHCIKLLLKLISSQPTVTRAHAQLVIGLAVAVNPHLSEVHMANLVSVLGALSNLASCAEEQQVFLTNAIQFNVEYLAGNEFRSAISSVQSFLSYVGLQSEAPRSDAEWLSSVHYRNRLNMKFHLTAIAGLLQQVEGSRFGAPIHPLFPLLSPILPSFFYLAQLLNSIYGPGVVVTSVHPSYGCRGEVLEMSSTERQAIIRTVLSDMPPDGMDYENNDGGGTGELAEVPVAAGASAPSPVISPIVCLRTFISEITEIVQTILASIGEKLHREFFSPEYAQSAGVDRLLLETIAHVEHVPDHRLHLWIRRTWSRLICNCPADRAELVVPMVREYTRHMQVLLIAKWMRELGAREKSDDDSPDPTEEDLLAETLLCMISREHASLLKSLTVADSLPSPTNASSSTTGAKQPQSQRQQEPQISALGAQLFRDTNILKNVVAALGQLVGCPDTQSALKCAPVVEAIVSNLATCPIDAEMAGYLLMHAIRSLQLNGAEDLVASPLLSLIYQLYFHLRPVYPTLLAMIQEVPDQSADVIQRFDELMLAATAKADNVPERQKRDVVRKLLMTVIGRPTSSLFKRKTTLRTRSS